MRLSRLGERRVLRRVRSLLGKPGKTGLNDDCFIDRNNLAVSTDSGLLSELPQKGFDAGRKAVACTASDLYSSGAKPKYFFVNLLLPRTMGSEWVKRFFQGAQLEAKRAGGRIAGGDLGEGEGSYTVSGVGKAKKPLLRSRCRKGQRLVCSGTVGGAAAARIAKKKKFACYSEFKKALDLPHPNYSFCRRAWKKARAGMDVSDGLAFTLHELARLSRVKIIVEELPIPKRLPSFCEAHGLDLVDTATRYGEDYCCVFSGFFKKGFARVEKGEGVFLEKQGGLIPLKKEGWESFTG